MVNKQTLFLLFLTMNTSKRINEVEFFNTTNKAKQSTWSKPKKYASLIKYRMLRWLFCVNDEMLDEIEQECAVRDAIRLQMIEHAEGSGRGAIEQTMRDVYDSTGYDMSNFKHEEMCHLSREREGVCDEQEPDSDGIVFGDLPPVKADEEVRVVFGLETVGNDSEVNRGTSMVIPKFAAAVVLALRSKLGKLAPSEANRLLIEREYLKVCRDTSVRNVDTIMHQQFVMNAYFTEGIVDQLATTRVRLPKWLREAFVPVPNAEPTIC